ncbi:hypothetical protein GCM10011385_34020 [Nitratireductor aestuarii]|uniref:ABC transporter substrate-binding protein n=1 Tax=Nitratireductor aestuarii TaxID=1735103 RepID=A0A916S1N1_9HYPH|nr:ABC transporter substrate-binding protein [Nitratireductor aestuarii]GGA77111.1 hypothetical protein GCM10011385_34020 [Nitratireductor aestuarii]
MAVNSYRRLVLKLGLAAAVAGATLTGSYAQSAGEPTELKIGWLRSSLSLILHPIAVEEGLYEKHGIKPIVTEVRSGDGSVGTQTVMMGNLDVYIGVVSDVAKLNSHAKDGGQPLPLTIMALGSPGATNLVLRKDLPYDGVESLKGLKLGVSSLGSAHLVTFRHFLSEQGTTVEQLGVELVKVGGSDMPPALVTGQIDGFLHSQPTPSIAEASGAGKLVLAPKDMGTAGKSPNVGLIVSREWLAKNQDVAERLVAVHREASELYKTLPDERIVEIAMKYLGGEPELIAASIPAVDPSIVDLKEGADTYWAVEMSAMKERGEVTESFEQADMFALN